MSGFAILEEPGLVCIGLACSRVVFNLWYPRLVCFDLGYSRVVDNITEYGILDWCTLD